MAGIKVLCVVLCILAVSGSPFPDAKADAIAESNPKPLPVTNPDPKADAKPDPKPTPKADAKPTPKAEAKPKSAADPKSNPKPNAEAKPSANPKAKAAPKADAKPKPKPSADPKAEGDSQNFDEPLFRPLEDPGRIRSLKPSTFSAQRLNPIFVEEPTFFQGENNAVFDEEGRVIEIPFQRQFFDSDPEDFPQGLRPLPISNDGKVLAGTFDERLQRQLEIPVRTGIIVSSEGERITPGTPLGVPSTGSFNFGRPVNPSNNPNPSLFPQNPITTVTTTPNFPGSNNLRPNQPNRPPLFLNPAGQFPRPTTPQPFAPNPTSPRPFTPNLGSPRPFTPNVGSPRPFTPNVGSPRPFSPVQPPLFLNPSDGNAFPRPTSPRPISPQNPTNPPLFLNPSSQFPITSNERPSFFFNPQQDNFFTPEDRIPFLPDSSDVDHNDRPPIFLNPNVNTNDLPPLFLNPNIAFDVTPPRDPLSVFLTPTNLGPNSHFDPPIIISSTRPSPSPRPSPPFLSSSPFPGSLSPRPTTPSIIIPRPTTPNPIFPQPIPTTPRPLLPRPVIPETHHPRPTTIRPILPHPSTPRPPPLRPTVSHPIFPQHDTPGAFQPRPVDIPRSPSPNHNVFNPTAISPRPHSVSIPVSPIPGSSHGGAQFFPSSTPFPPAFPFNPPSSTIQPPIIVVDNNRNPPFNRPTFVNSIPVGPTPRPLPGHPIDTGISTGYLPPNPNVPFGSLEPPQYNYGEGPAYTYEYSINDPSTGNIQGAHERKGQNGVVTGGYHFVQPDGQTRVVSYSADDHNGFQADVNYLPPPPPPAYN